MPPADKDKIAATWARLAGGRMRVTAIEVLALLLSLLWIGTSLIVLLGLPPDADAPPDPWSFAAAVFATVIPVALIWIAAVTVRAAQTLRDRAEDLQQSLAALRQAQLAGPQETATARQDSTGQRLEELTRLVRQIDLALTTQRVAAADLSCDAPPDAGGDPAPPGAQPQFDLEPAAAPAAAGPDTLDMISALNFPKTVDDAQGFAALRRALKDRDLAQIIQSAQDVLTLLSQDGIYMDDLTPDMARPELWRHFAEGVRGPAVAALGGIRDADMLARTTQRMRQDAIFRDTAHHFMRKFDRLLEAFAPEASDAELSALGQTRTARAFMLLARVAGTFD